MKNYSQDNINNYKKLVRYLRLKKKEGETNGKVSTEKTNSNK
jgi:hypothetical protein